MARTDDALALSFDQLQEMAALPASAWKYDWWWANEDPATTTHVQCKSWQAAGYEADVDRAHAMVTFRRKARGGKRS
ncbi:hypothetical protein [Mesorhizobium sp. BR1-1-14]|uniref:DUF7662 domain-containing protein n=1 Tax=Mesorhizobium sp. BR1-1-14 TaxID=2876655 RepID=UPI001CD0F5C1|nr:hypothetical protein [Mesorhizobium sp. BR1-1-14]MBZ9959027.1 hypothetical protein [Mesorhizobium sp. BR1-1-14]